MKICEDCQHNAVCKYRKGVLEYEPESVTVEGLPLVAEFKCKHKLFMETVSCPSVWTYVYPNDTDTIPNVTYTVCP